MAPNSPSDAAGKTVDLSIIIVNWNSKDYVAECIESVRRSVRILSHEIIVVDSGSFDGCGEMLANHPDVRFIQVAQNVGFGRANNIGAKQARGTVLLLLNPDTQVRGDAVETLYAHTISLANPGVVGCRLVNADTTLQTSCVQVIPTILNQLINVAILQRLFPTVGPLQTAMSFEDVDAPVPVEALSGACMMIRREAFESVDGFSKDYFMYGEDIDLCYKMRSLGRANYYCRDSEMLHHGGKSSGHKASRFSDVMVREAVYRFLRKTRGGAYGVAYRIALAGSAVARLTLLVVVLPSVILPGAFRTLYGMTSKWIGILRWAVGLEHWVHDYDLPRDAESGAGEAAAPIGAARMTHATDRRPLACHESAGHVDRCSCSEPARL